MKVNKNLQKKIDKLPLSPGVYIYRDAKGRILYVGKSVRIRDRVKSYFANYDRLLPKTAQLVLLIRDIEHIVTESEIEALLLEASLIKKHKPFYNTIGKDDKTYVYIKIQNAKYRRRRGITKTVAEDRWPFVTTSRKTDDKDAIYFGPFPQGNTVRNLLKAMRRIFPWCKYSSRQQLKRAGKACFYSHINLCPGICDDSFGLKDYWHEIDRLLLFLEGKRSQVQKQLINKMNSASKIQDYESAAGFRDTLVQIDYITQNFRGSGAYLENPNLIDDVRANEITELFDVLGLPLTKDPLQIVIEGYDISNLGKENTVASRVTFLGGEPFKQLYRRYKIKRNKLPDDFAAMQEVIRRRIKSEDAMPDLILIDGGKGQVAAVSQVLQKFEVTVPYFGLAKRVETIIQPKDYDQIVDEESDYNEILLAKDSAARKLIQRVRDEAHRFAQRYHKKLRAERLIKG
ncbi:GIY-YIG nuclease family protein [candidate division WWE3 bacterium]|uniref:GIY-YIG nuclease family protein n=1 Tax=candidate division WWE3 bacterium TaxID=2053526 RepID=A0A955LKQ3_UNCKA|nr:GIY-YIG nuclease family protein [candidate division WWE3 bacterium]